MNRELNSDEWEKRRNFELNANKHFIEKEMGYFDSFPRDVRDALNYQERHGISAMGLHMKWNFMKRQRKNLTPMGVVKLAQKGRIRMNRTR